MKGIITLGSKRLLKTHLVVILSKTLYRGGNGTDNF
jgi:hypothetical protein